SITGKLSTGELTVSGLTSYGLIEAPYFTATSTTANSTFPNLLATNSTTTNATTTNLFATNGTFTNFTGTYATVTNATSTSLYSSVARFVTGIIDTLTATLATITTAVIANLTATNSTFTYATTTNATTTGALALTFTTPSRLLFVNASGNATSTNLSSWVSGTTNQVTVTDNAAGGVVLSLPSLLSLTNASSTALSALDFVSVGRTATSTIRGDGGTTNLAGILSVANYATASYFIGTSTSQASVLPYASSTALTVSGALYNTALTATRIPFASTGGLFTDSANLTFDSASGRLTTIFASTTALSVSGSSYFATSGGRVGVGTTTPAVAFDVYATDAVRLPVGTSAQRPGGDIGFVRFNTTTHQFEGYGDNSVWQGLGGVIDADQNTYITADTNNTNEDTLRFVTAGSERMTIAPGGNVGVGSTSPYAKLSVKGAGTTTGVNFQTTNSSNSPLFSILDSGAISTVGA
ncbi:MAG: hypothetical protein AAB737_02495, partial [Patescibacteria group bacterium]